MTAGTGRLGRKRLFAVAMIGVALALVFAASWLRGPRSLRETDVRRRALEGPEMRGRPLEAPASAPVAEHRPEGLPEDLADRYTGWPSPPTGHWLRNNPFWLNLPSGGVFLKTHGVHVFPDGTRAARWCCQRGSGTTTPRRWWCTT